MIAILLTLLCLFIMYVGSDDSTTVIAMVVVIALIWICHVSIVNDAKAYVNRREYWAKSEKERIRDRIRYEEEVRAEEAQKRWDAEERERLRAEREKARQERAAARRVKTREAKKDPVLMCDRCGREVRVIRRMTYKTGRTYAEYQCPYCSERRLKKIG